MKYFSEGIDAFKDVAEGRPDKELSDSLAALNGDLKARLDGGASPDEFAKLSGLYEATCAAFDISIPKEE